MRFGRRFTRSVACVSKPGENITVRYNDYDFIIIPIIILLIFINFFFTNVIVIQCLALSFSNCAIKGGHSPRHAENRETC